MRRECKIVLSLSGATTQVAPFRICGVFGGVGVGDFIKNEISVKIKPNNPTTQHLRYKIIKEMIGLYDMLLKFILLTIPLSFVRFCWVCWESVGKVLGFAPFCWVLNVNFGFC